jgi:hypothetical protein
VYPKQFQNTPRKTFPNLPQTRPREKAHKNEYVGDHFNNSKRKIKVAKATVILGVFIIDHKWL